MKKSKQNEQLPHDTGQATRLMQADNQWYEMDANEIRANLHRSLELRGVQENVNTPDRPDLSIMEYIELAITEATQREPSSLAVGEGA